MKKILTILAFATALFYLSTANAQNNYVLFASTRVPQINTLNPAFYPSQNTFYLSSLGLNLRFHSPLSFNDMFQRTDSVTYININDIANHLTDDNNIVLNTDIDMFGMGLHIRNVFVTLSSKIRFNSHIGIPPGLISFLQDGNYDHRGEGNELYILDGNILQAQLYNEYALGVGYTYKDLTVGMRLKYLLGLIDARTEGTQLSLYTDNDLSSLRADLYYKLTLSGIPNFKSNADYNILSYLKEFLGNSGFSFDIGAKYTWNNFEFSASVIDLGKGIHWRKNIRQFSPHGQQSITFEGIDFTRIIVDGKDTTLQHTFDAVRDSLGKVDTLQGSPYWTSIPTQFNLGAVATLGSIMRAGFLFHGEIDHNISHFNASGKAISSKNLFRSATTFMVGINLANWLELMGSIAVVKDGLTIDWFNPGVGVNFSLGGVLQAYALLNYISNIRLVKAKSANIQLGFNMLFGKGPSKKVEIDAED